MGQRAQDRGFTLVELLVVVSIMALLAVFAVPKLAAAWNTSKQTQSKRDLRSIHDALERHYADLGYYPVKLSDLITHKYLKPGLTFQSPASKQLYFYGVDDNRSNNSPRAYVLGDPGPKPGAPYQLRRAGPLPAGTKPGQRARAWKANTGTGRDNLELYDEDGTGMDIDDMPNSLAAYRDNCRPPAATLCDLWAN